MVEERTLVRLGLLASTIFAVRHDRLEFELKSLHWDNPMKRVHCTAWYAFCELYEFEGMLTLSRESPQRSRLYVVPQSFDFLNAMAKIFTADTLRDLGCWLVVITETATGFSLSRSTTSRMIFSAYNIAYQEQMHMLRINADPGLQLLRDSHQGRRIRSGTLRFESPIAY